MGETPRLIYWNEALQYLGLPWKCNGSCLSWQAWSWDANHCITKTILQNEGIKAFHKGLSVGLLRKTTYTTARLGSFKVLTNKVVAANDGKPLPLYEKALCGVTTGAIRATVGSPPDSSLIRMQADATLPTARCQNYKNAFHALYCCRWMGSSTLARHRSYCSASNDIEHEDACILWLKCWVFQGFPWFG